MKIVRTGITRVVILTKYYAIKVPNFTYSWKHFLLGLLANMQEVQFETMKDPRMCPVLWSIPGGWMLVMPRCEPLTRDEFFALDMADFAGVPVENKIDSFGWFDGNIVAIDYGS